MPFLECFGLTKRFGSISIFKELELSVDDNRILIAGPNGLGKSTLIKLIYGLQRPNEGFLKIMGLDPSRNEDRIRKDISYLPAEPSFPPYYRISDLYDFAASFASFNTIEKLERELGIIGLRDRYPRFLSSGEKQILSIVIAFSMKKKAFLLDEAISSVDPTRRRRIIKMISEFKGGLIITTHEMTELVSVTDSVLKVFRSSNGDRSLFEVRNALELPILVSSRNLQRHREELIASGIECLMEGPLIKSNGHVRGIMDVIGDDLLFAKRDFNE